jgi:hypothetical protein
MKYEVEGIMLLDSNINRNKEINSNFLARTVLLHVVAVSVVVGYQRPSTKLLSCPKKKVPSKLGFC